MAGGVGYIQVLEVVAHGEPGAAVVAGAGEVERNAGVVGIDGAAVVGTSQVYYLALCRRVLLDANHFLLSKAVQLMIHMPRPRIWVVLASAMARVVVVLIILCD